MFLTVHANALLRTEAWGEVRWLALMTIPEALLLRGHMLCASVLSGVGNLLIPLCPSPSVEPGPE